MSDKDCSDGNRPVAEPQVSSEVFGFTPFLLCDQQGMCPAIPATEPLPGLGDVCSDDELMCGPSQSSSGKALRIVLDPTVRLVIWGREVELTPSEFKERAGALRVALISEGTIIEQGLRSEFEVFDGLVSEFPVTSRVSALVKGAWIPNRQPLIDLAERVRTAREAIVGTSIDPHALRRTGLTYTEVRKEGDILVRHLQRTMQESAEGAERAVAGLTLTSDASFELVRVAGQIYVLGNPLKQAALDIAILLARLGASSTGILIAYGDERDSKAERNRILGKNLREVLLREVPPILANLIDMLLRKHVTRLSGSSLNQSKKYELAVCRALVSFNLDLIGLALADGPVTTLAVLDKAFQALESALCDCIAIRFGLEKSTPPSWNVRLLVFNILAKVVATLASEMKTAKEEADKSNGQFSDALLGRLPGMLCMVVKIIVVEVAGMAIEKRWPEERARQEWEERKKSAHEKLNAIVGLLKPAPPPAAAEALPIERKEGSGAVVSAFDQRRRRKRGKKVDRADPDSTPLPASEQLSFFVSKEFKGLGLTEAKVDAGTRERLRDDLAAASYKSKPVDEKVAEVLAASYGYFREDVSDKPRQLYKFVAVGKSADEVFNTGYWLTETQRKQIEAKPALLREIYLALPAESHANEYAVYEVEVRAGKRLYRSEVAPTVEVFEDLATGHESKFIQLAGAQKSAPDGQGGRVSIVTEQVIIPNEIDVSRPLRLSETVKIPEIVPPESFVCEAGK